MRASFLSIDLGNSRLKACLVDAAGIPELVLAAPFSRDAASTNDFVQEVARELATSSTGLELTGAALSSVAERELEVALVAALGAALHVTVEVNPDSGLELALRSAETVGRDRLYAARGAIERHPAGALVVDAGTALTVDAVDAADAADAVSAGEGSAARGVFLGGAIAPGPSLLARALASGAARLPQIEPEPGHHALGRDTAEALGAGVTVGFEGAALRLVERIAAESGLDRAPIFLTGGARDFLTETLFLPGHDVIVEPHLVHLGLAAASGIALR